MASITKIKGARKVTAHTSSKSVPKSTDNINIGTEIKSDTVTIPVDNNKVEFSIININTEIIQPENVKNVEQVEKPKVNGYQKQKESRSQKKINIALPESAVAGSVISEMYKKYGNTINVSGYDCEPCPNFGLLDLKPELLRGIHDKRWELCSPIQSVAIKPLIEGRDLFCQSQTGTGKTGTFLIAILQIIEESINRCQSIILAPTRELAIQIFDVATELAKHMNVTIACHTGTSIQTKPSVNGNEEKKKSSKLNFTNKLDDRGVSYMHNVKPDNNEIGTYSIPQYAEHLVIATPGKLLRLLQTEMIQTSDIKLVVMDEADKILDQGFMNSVIQIFSAMPDIIKIALYSATLSHEIKQISKDFMDNPVYVLVANENVMMDNQTQYVVKPKNPTDKDNILTDIFKASGIGQVMIFANRKHTVDYIKSLISNLGISVESLHGEIESDERNINMTKFKNGNIKVLVCTDVAGRGIDTDVDVVINYDIPTDVDQFVHRSGRTGRFGRSGSVINIVSEDDTPKIRRITSVYSTKLLPIAHFYDNRGTLSKVI
jgi:superfamily II DNA/RNA helicase